ncbi:MAG: GNAT family N-acetyltransferase, partial [bacterium]
VWSRLSSSSRNKIRKAEKSGLQVDFGFHYLEDFYSIYAQNLRHLGTPVFPLSMFEAVADVFRERCELLILKLKNRPVSGMFLFKFKDVISEPWVASLRQYNKIYINNYLYWQALKYACENGFKKFDFGRSTVDAGTYRYKLQWGAQPVPLYYQYYLNKSRQIPVVDAHDNRYQKIIDIWKKMPLKLTNFIGPKVVQFLPEL